MTAEQTVGLVLALVILLQVAGCVAWYAWMVRHHHSTPAEDSPGAWHYDPRHGQYLPGDHWHQTRGPTDE